MGSSAVGAECRGRVAPASVVVAPDSSLLLPGGSAQLSATVRGASGAARPVERGVVRCGIPGYDEPGEELYADELIAKVKAAGLWAPQMPRERGGQGENHAGDQCPAVAPSSSTIR